MRICALVAMATALTKDLKNEIEDEVEWLS
jgi:hypothetical protein